MIRESRTVVRVYPWLTVEEKHIGKLWRMMEPRFAGQHRRCERLKKRVIIFECVVVIAEVQQ